MNSFTCSCDNVIPVVPEMSGKSIECPKCKQRLTIPVFPSAAITPAPAPRPIAKKTEPKPPTRRKRRPVPVRSSGGGSGMMIVGALSLVVAIVVVIVVVSGQKTPPPADTGGTEQPVVKRDLPEKAKKEEKKKEEEQPDEGPGMISKEYRSKLDLYNWRLNLSGIAAAYLDYRARFTREEDARSRATDLRYNMSRMETQHNQLVDFLRQRGETPYIADHIRSDDEIRLFDNKELSKLSDRDAMALLGRFVREVKAGSRVSVVVIRRGGPKEFTVLFDQRPKELMNIIQVADMIPGRENPTVKKDPPKGGETKRPDPPPPPKSGELDDAFDTLIKPEMRRVATNRAQARDAFERRGGQGSDYAAAAAMFLNKSDADWNLTKDPALPLLQEYFTQHAKIGAKGFSKDQHAKAVEFLSGAIHKAGKLKSAAGPHVLLLFAHGHLGEAVARWGGKDDDVKKAVASMGYSVSEDGKVVGTRASVGVYDLTRHGTDFNRGYRMVEDRFSAASGFPLKYARMYYVVGYAADTAKELQKAHGLATALSKSGKKGARPHFDAIAKALLDMGKCSNCSKGEIPCDDCGGDGRKDITCPDCDGDGRIEYGAGSSFFKYCKPCNRTGQLKNTPCKKCKKRGKLRCPQCDLKGWLKEPSAGGASAVFTSRDCGTCEGRGILLPHVADLCPECHGLRRKLVPTVDPSATLD